MRRLFAVAVVALGLVPGTAAAQDASFGQGADGACPVYPAENGQEQEICTAQVPSFDDTPLDVDLTRPLNEQDGKRHPLIVMLHGFGNDKYEWQSLDDEGDGADKLRWNSHWFAQHGYYVLTYTARGFRTDAAPRSKAQTPRGTSASEPNGKLRLKSRESEIRDTQYLAALAASQFDIDPERIAVTGGSYGGGESWVQASQAEWTWANEEFGLPKLSLQVAVPKYPWTDLAYALAPNGHPGLVGQGSGDPIYESSQAAPTSQTGQGNPVGSPKSSYLAGLFAVGASNGIYEDGASNQATTTEGPINIASWQTRIMGGPDPYKEPDPIVMQIGRGLTEYRSAYYQDQQWAAQQDGRKVAIYSIQGWTDDLFHAVESFRMFKYLKRLDPRWPVEVELADVGHSRAQNRPETWRRLNHQAFRFLQAHINGSHEQETTVASQPTQCAVDGDPDSNTTAAMRVTGRSPEDLANGRLTVAFPGGTLTNASGANDPNGPATDPILPEDTPLPGFSGNPCRTSPGPSPSYTAVSPPLRSTTTYVGLGSVTLPYSFVSDVGTATVHARVWDVPPSGQPTLLMTRGTYRLEAPQDDPVGTIRLPLFGNHWQLEPGHRIRLDLVEVDALTFKPTTSVNTVNFAGATLELPTRDAGTTRLVGTRAP